MARTIIITRTIIEVRLEQLPLPDCLMIASSWVLRILSRILDRERQETAERWSRNLPTGEYFSDRWKRAETLGFGNGASIYDTSVVLGDVKVGSDTWIGPFVVLDGSGGLRIGRNCSISAGVHIYTHNTVRQATSGGRDNIERAPTLIGSNVYVGPNSVIAMGVSIGDGVVIGANSFVNSDIPANCRAWGNPCQIQRAKSASDSDHLT